MKIKRRKSRVVRVGHVPIGGEHPIAIQSMTKTATVDVESTVKQIKKLENAGCEIVRLAVKDFASARVLKKIKGQARIPIVADIHFDWRLAIAAIESGVDKIRLNPGNIFKAQQVREVVAAAKSAGIPIRVGVNSGSVRRTTSQKQSITQAMVKSTLEYVKMLERFRFRDIVISLKGSDIFDTMEAYRAMAKICDYPLHLGVTATGLASCGVVKSSIALGALLMDGIGDTLRVSLTDDPVQEVRAARLILGALGKRSFGHEVISCPTCGRCEVDLVKIVKSLENKLSASEYRPSARPLKVAVMGCVVNGPGEAADADIGIAFGRREGMLFKKGKQVRKVSFSDCLRVLLKEMERPYA